MTIRKLSLVLLLTLAPPAFSQSAPTLWEYKMKTINLLGDEGTTKQLNYAAKDGWELVSCTESDGSLSCIFKRPEKS